MNTPAAVLSPPWPLQYVDAPAARDAAQRDSKVLPFPPALLLIALPGLAASAFADTSTAPPVEQAVAAPAPIPTQPPPMLLRPLSSAAAFTANQAIPFSTAPNFPAKPFHFTGGAAAKARALSCLTAAVYYEAGSQDEAGQRAVAQVVLNRVRHPAFPASICGVVFQGSTLSRGCQFTFTCDGSLLRVPDRRGWKAAEAIAQRALSGDVFSPVGLSTHYHADYVLPYWATSLAKDAQVGVHIFYRWPREWGAPSAFRQHYAGDRLDFATLRTASLIAHDNWPDSLVPVQGGSIEFAADPRVEMIGVLGLLASVPSAYPSQYETDVRSYFQSSSDLPAIQLLRFAKGSSATGAAAPQAAISMSDAMHDFAEKSGFETFFETHSQYYKQAESRANRSAAAAVAAWESYTAIPVRGRKVTLAVGLADERSTCLARNLAQPTPLWTAWRVQGADAPAADLFVGTGVSNGILNQPSIPKGVEEQIVRAVFARVQALSLGPRAGQFAIASDVDRGFTLVPLLAARLEDYERHRAAYPTLADFLPKLLAPGLPADANAATATSTMPKDCGVGLPPGSTAQANPAIKTTAAATILASPD